LALVLQPSFDKTILTSIFINTAVMGAAHHEMEVDSQG
jgi:hypothetical protein